MQIGIHRGYLAEDFESVRLFGFPAVPLSKILTDEESSTDNFGRMGIFGDT